MGITEFMSYPEELQPKIIILVIIQRLCQVNKICLSAYNPCDNGRRDNGKFQCMSYLNEAVTPQL